MTVTKEELREFIEEKTKNKIGIIEEEVDAMINELLQPYFTKHIIGDELTKIGSTAGKLALDIQKYVETFLLYNQMVGNAIYYLNRSIADFEKTIKTMVFQKIKDVVGEEKSYCTLESARRDKNKYDEELLAITTTAIEKAKPYYRKIHQLTKLKNEIYSVIKAERTGQKAFKRLIELGVDMSGFTPSDVQLPAIMTLSINVNLLND